MLTLYCRKTKVTFEELLRFRNSLSNSSLLALILVSDFNENNEAFVKSLEKIDFPLNELGGALTEWTYQRIGDLMTDNSGFNEDPKKKNTGSDSDSEDIFAFTRVQTRPRNREKIYGTFTRFSFLHALYRHGYRSRFRQKSTG